MTTHLSDQLVELFRSKKLSPEEIIALHQHIQSCEGCHQKLVEPEQLLVVARAFQVATANSAPETETEHLSFEELARYVDGRLVEVEREIADAHLLLCSDCATEILDQQRFKAAPRPSAATKADIEAMTLRERFLSFLSAPGRLRPLPIAVLALIIVGAAILIGNVVLITERIDRDKQTSPGREAAGAIEKQSEAAVDNPPELDQNTVRPPVEEVHVPLRTGKDRQEVARRGNEAYPFPRPVVKLRDGSRVVTLDSRGRLAELNMLPASLQTRILRTLTAARVAQPTSLLAYHGGAAGQRSISNEPTSFTLVSPVATAVATDRPTFRWRPLSGAATYTVAVFDAGLNKVIESDPLTGTEWKSPRPLPRTGTIYKWQVTAVKDGQTVVAPQSTEPEAKFRVLDQSQMEELERALQVYPDSHLTLGVLSAEFGLREEAEREFRLLLEQNPHSRLAKKLWQSLRSERRKR